MLNPIPDGILVERLRTGDEAALALIYKQYWKNLFTSAYKLLKDKEVCEDVIQDVFSRLWHRRESLEINTTLQVYLKAATRYEVYRHIREDRGREDLIERLYEHKRATASNPWGDLEHKELLTRIHHVVETLPEKCREVYKLSRENHLSHKEIAGRLNISTKTVENHLTKALKCLKSSLGDILALQILFFWLGK